VTPVGPEQRLEQLDAVSEAALVGVGPVGSQVAVAVVVPAGHLRRRRRPTPGGTGGGRLTLALAELTDRVRGAAGVDVAAVLVTSRLPVDIRHQSKVDRAELSRRATRVLSGTPVHWGHRRAGAP